MPRKHERNRFQPPKNDVDTSDDNVTNSELFLFFIFSLIFLIISPYGEPK
jgi:hypothetical protein